MTTHSRTFDSILRLLRSAETAMPAFPPTELFNETWMLRLVLDALQRHGGTAPGLAFSPRSSWYSEARMRSPFLGRWRGDPLAEGFTHTDAVIGQIAFQRGTRAGFILAPGTTQLVVVEAKMFSNLASGVKWAPKWSQASRTLACMAFALRQAGRPLSDYASLGFTVLAPKRELRGPGSNLEACLDPAVVRREVRSRVAAYSDGDESAHDDLCCWEQDWLHPLLQRLQDTNELGVLTWERCVEALTDRDADAGADLLEFYERCLTFSPHLPAMTSEPA